MGLYARIHAAFYDRFMAGTERAGLAEVRHNLLARAEGRVVEVGSGTGRNLDHYPDGCELVLTEPDEPMARKLEGHVAEEGGRAEVRRAPAEALPFPDDSFDTAVSTLALCTVADPSRALAEVRRVLKPGGRLLFVEHVRYDDARQARRQDRMDPIWRRLGHGCRCNRPTEASIRAAGFEIAEIEHGQLPKAPRFVRPLISGWAIAP